MFTSFHLFATLYDVEMVKTSLQSCYFHESDELAMAKVNEERLVANIEGDFIVFLIGMRKNKPWKPHKWLPVFLSMPKMLKELDALPSYEAVYSGMPPYGLGRVSALLPATGNRNEARERLMG